MEGMNNLGVVLSQLFQKKASLRQIEAYRCTVQSNCYITIYLSGKTDECGLIGL